MKNYLDYMLGKMKIRITKTSHKTYLITNHNFPNLRIESKRPDQAAEELITLLRSELQDCPPGIIDVF